MAAICVFCSSYEGIGPEYLILARDVGTALAARGHSLVTGGGTVSMMGAVASAARAGGARTVGVIPRLLYAREIGDEGSDELIVVDTMRQRKQVMDDRADAFLVLPGGLGTFEEMFEAWTGGYLGSHAKPVVALDVAGFFAPLWAYLDDLAARGFVGESAMRGLVRASTVDEALDAIDSSLAP